MPKEQDDTDDAVLKELKNLALGYLLTPPETPFQSGYLSCALDVLRTFDALQEGEWVAILEASADRVMRSVPITSVTIVEPRSN